MTNAIAVAGAMTMVISGTALADKQLPGRERGELALSRTPVSVAPGEFALDACGGRDKAYLHPTPDATNVNHLWTIEHVGEYVMFVSRVERMALDANAGRGNPYPRTADSTNDNHLWILAQVGDFVMMWSKVDKVVLDANGGRGRPYLSADPDPRNENQLWMLRPVGDDVMIVPKVVRTEMPMNLESLLPAVWSRRSYGATFILKGSRADDRSPRNAAKIY